MTPEELRTAADDLDRLEELEPRPGRVGLANRLRRFANSWRLRSDFGVVPLEEQERT